MVKKGNIPWNKGLKINTSIYPNYGMSNKHHTEEEKRKMSRTWFQKDMLPWNKGLTKKIDQRIKGGTFKGHIPWNKGKNLSREHIEKLKINHKGMAGLKHSESTKQKIQIARLKQILPQKDTSIEIKVQNQLDKNKIKYTKHKTLLGRTQPDLFIEPSDQYYKGVAIYLDGDYWHNRPEVKSRDERQTNELFKQGYYVVRLKESHIKEKDFNIVPILEEIMPLYHVRKENRELVYA